MNLVQPKLLLPALTVGATALAFSVSKSAYSEQILPRFTKSPAKGESVSSNTPLPSARVHLLKKYLRTSDSIQAFKRRLKTERYLQTSMYLEKADQELKGSSQRILRDLRLRKRTQVGKQKNSLITVDVATFNSVILPNSATSQSLFSSLCSEGLADVRDSFVFLNQSHKLNPSWISFFQKLVADSASASTTRQVGVKILYKFGVRNAFYASELRKMAQKDDVDALELLFFTINFDTGEDEPVVNNENATLLSQFSTPSNRVAYKYLCARYAIAIGNRELGRAICEDILSTRYKGFDDVDAAPPAEDYTLSFYREAAMNLLFFRLPNEKSFEAVYNTINTEKREKVSLQGQMVKNTAKAVSWVKFDTYPLARLEIARAKEMIAEISDAEVAQ